LPTTNPTWTGQGANLGLHGDRPATNHMNHGMATFRAYNVHVYADLSVIKVAFQANDVLYILVSSFITKINEARILRA
jgi:hypothetical protein